MNVFLLIAALICATLAAEKRAVITCRATTVNTWSSTCSSASGGTFCLQGSDSNTGSPLCGCKVDDDCVSNADFPYCSLYTGKTGGECVGCDQYPGVAKDQHYFCRNRYPSSYLAGGVPTDPDGTNLELTSTEQIPIPGFFREVCVLDKDAAGACQRCNQASPLNTPENTYPDYPTLYSLSVDDPSVEGLYGTFHCGTIRPTRPICADYQYFIDSGIPDTTASNAWTKLHVTMDIAHSGKAGQTNVDRTTELWEGACVPCGLIEDGKTEPTFFHELCSRARVTAPICKGTGCNKCASNSECANGAAQKSGFFTGGIYCFSDGHCGPCKSDADCTAVTSAGYKCVSGVCNAPVLCKENSDCNAGENCMKDGTCRGCTNNADCKSNDGGSLNDQPICASGVCRYCTGNVDCNAGAGGANCQATGQCVDCGSNAQCGVLDGPGTIANTATDKSGQAICNTATKICEDRCASNDECTRRGSFGSFNRGNNCQADGTCQDCTTSPDSCGVLDLGNEKTCDTTTKRCYNPFTCSENADCSGAGNTGGGKNCQSNNVCISCTVTKLATTCGTSDGGTPSGQPNCLSASRLCTDACTSNDSCQGTQGANCMNNGVCFDCESDADCAATGNAWGGDKSGQTLCDSGSKLCVSPCARNSDCPAQTNCNKDGRCSACTTNELCAANDGGELKNQPICNPATKQCGPCTKNSDCNADNANCGADGACYDCTDADKSCGATDGGENPGQLNCDTSNGICVDYCTSDEQCTTDCLPHCNLDRGCCVECTKDADCPLKNWRNDEAKKTHCYDSFCTEPRECVNDDDCSGDKPACSVTQGVCVECVFDDHCTGDKKACATNQQMCVTCVSNSNCDATKNEFCATDNECHDDAAALSFGVLAAAVAVLYRLF